MNVMNNIIKRVIIISSVIFSSCGITEWKKISRNYTLDEFSYLIERTKKTHDEKYNRFILFEELSENSQESIYYTDIDGVLGHAYVSTYCSDLMKCNHSFFFNINTSERNGVNFHYLMKEIENLNNDTICYPINIYVSLDDNQISYNGECRNRDFNVSELNTQKTSELFKAISILNLLTNDYSN